MVLLKYPSNIPNKQVFLVLTLNTINFPQLYTIHITLDTQSILGVLMPSNNKLPHKKEV